MEFIYDTLLNKNTKMAKNPEVMNKNVLIALMLALLAGGCGGDPSSPEKLFKPISFSYPATFRDTLFTDSLHGTAIADPCRWMEAEEAPLLEEWLNSQAKISQGYLDDISFRPALERRIREIWNYERQSSPVKKGDFHYYLKNGGLQDHDVLYRLSLAEAREEIVLDPNGFSKDGSEGLGQTALSADGRYLAFEKTRGGSDWRTIQVLDVEEKKLLSDTLRWVKYSQIAWAGEGFFYSRYPAPLRGDKTSTPMEFHQVVYHRIGRPQEEDQLIFADRARSRRGFSTQTSADERFLVLSIWETHSGNGVYVMDLTKENREFIPVVDDIANEFTFIGVQGDHLLFATNFEADKRRVIKVSPAKPDPGFWEEVVPERGDALKEAFLAGGKLVVHYLRDAQSILQVFEADGAEAAILPMPEAGAIDGFQGQWGEKLAYFTFESVLKPPTIYELDLELLTMRVYKAPKVNFNASAYETKQVFFKSPDGVDIPVFITQKKAARLDGARPTLLQGEGSFGAYATLRFHPELLSFLENGGMLAQALIRGGGEYGRKWYESGCRNRKQTTFDDFQAAAGFLISQGYTRKDKLAIMGKGAGGMLVGVSLTQRPDLFQAAVAESGLYDMIRYQQFTIGEKWAFDFGRAENAREFDRLNAWSPLHNALPAEYPATMIIAGTNDDRMYPAHSWKFTAELQAQQRGPAPILLWPEPGGGIGAKKTSASAIKDSANQLSFILYHLKQPVVYELGKS
jgi:prolyl oligopeptidase